MKNKLTFLFVLTSSVVLAQFNWIQNERLSAELARNLELYSQAYVGPAMERLPQLQLLMMPQVRTHEEVWKLEVGFSAGFLQGPADELGFDFNAIPFTNLELENPSDPYLPTVLGTRTDQHFLYTVTDENGNPISTPLSGPLKARIPAFSGMNLDGWLAYIRPQVSLGMPYGLEFQLAVVPWIRVQGLVWGDIGAEVNWKLNDLMNWNTTFWDVGVGAGFHHSSFTYLPNFTSGSDQKISLQFQSFLIRPYVAYRTNAFRALLRAGYQRGMSRFSILGTYAYQWENSGLSQLVQQDAAFYLVDPVNLSLANNVVPIELGFSLKTGKGWQHLTLIYGNQFGFTLGSTWKLF